MEVLNETGVKKIQKILEEHINQFGLNEDSANLLGLIKATREIHLILKTE